MKKFDVQIALEGVHEAKAAWAKAITKFNSDIDAMMARLLREAAVNYMSAEEVAKVSGFTVKRVRQMMRDAGLNPRDGKTLLSKKAAEALAENSALLGIEPHEMDLMSPLAYLPMGEQMRRDLIQNKVVSQVDPDEFLETPLLARVGVIIAEETSCGYCDGSCPACIETAQRIINVVQGA